MGEPKDLGSTAETLARSVIRSFVRVFDFWFHDKSSTFECVYSTCLSLYWKDDGNLVFAFDYQIIRLAL